MDEALDVALIIVVCLGTLALSLVTIWMAIYLAFSPASCSAYGRKTGLTVEWGFWSACMVNVRGQWLRDSDVIPVERDGKIVFVPKPQPTVQLK